MLSTRYKIYVLREVGESVESSKSWTHGPMDGVNGNKKRSKRCHYQNLNRALKEVEILFLFLSCVSHASVTRFRSLSTLMTVFCNIL